MFYQPKLLLSPHEVLMYLRKSRSDDPTLTVEEVLSKHESMLDEWAENNLGGRVPQENRFYEVVSGETIADRPEIQKVLKLIESPKYKAVLIYDVARLSRGDLMDAGLLIRTFRYTNSMVLTKERVYDIRDEFDREFFERELKRGNEFLEYQKRIQQNGRLLSVSQGNYIGNVPPYGYDKDWVMDGKRKCPTLKINEEQADVVRMIFDMYVNQDMGRTVICHTLDGLKIKPPRGKKWSPESVWNMLQNIHYIGKVRWNWRKTVATIEDGEIIKSRPKMKIGEYLIYDGKHPSIIPDALFEAAQAKMGRNHRAKPNTKVRNPLASILYCQCGRAMSLRTYKSHGAPPRLLCDGQVHCKTGSCLYDEMIDRVCAILEQCIEDFEVRIQNDTGDSAKLHTKLINNLEKKLKELDKKEIAQWEAQTHPDPSQRMPPHIFKKLNEELLKEKEEINQALCKAYESMPEPIDYQERVGTFKEALAALKDPNREAEEKNRLLKECIERIEYKRDKPERIKSQQVRYYDPVQKRTRWKSPLKTGGNWTTPPIELDVKLKVQPLGE